jgi:DNA-directed RNA polymerase specialized sigma24 family protein
VNACRDHGRRSFSFARLRGGLSDALSLARAPDPRDLHRRAWLSSGIARLAPDLRAAVVLVAGEGMTHAEAGIALDVAEATVSWRMHEARKRLSFDRLEESLDVR